MPINKLRVYDEKTFQCMVYKKMYANQTLKFHESMIQKYQPLKRGRFSIKEVLKLLDNFVDPSDPDISLPNSVHAYQTAEKIRKDYPNEYEFQLCGLIHDLGKILYKFGEKSWGIVGDTYVLGCEIPENVVFRKFSKNHGYDDIYGIYKKGCGIKNLKLSFGHDEYMYMVLKGNEDKHKFREMYMDIIRFHSFYPWHTYDEYSYFMEKGDEEIKRNVLKLNDYDLYSKGDDINELCLKDENGEWVIREEIEEYYDNLINKYFPEKLNW